MCSLQQDLSAVCLPLINVIGVFAEDLKNSTCYAVSFLCCGMTWITEAFLFLSLSGCEAEVPLGSGWGHGEAGRTGEEDRQGCGRVQALLGGTQAGQTGQSTVLGGKGKQVLSLFGHVHFSCYVEHHIHFVLKNQEMTRDLSCTRSKLLYSL